MLPHIYAGAGQGIEDAYLLAQLLSYPQTTADNVEVVLSSARYDDKHRAHTAFVTLGNPSGLLGHTPPALPTHCGPER